MLVSENWPLDSGRFLRSGRKLLPEWKGGFTYPQSHELYKKIVSSKLCLVLFYNYSYNPIANSSDVIIAELLYFILIYTIYELWNVFMISLIEPIGNEILYFISIQSFSI